MSSSYRQQTQPMPALDGYHRKVCHVRVALLYSTHVFYRTIVAGILIFWGVMAAQLLRREVFSPEAQASPVPVEFVMKLMFHHKQMSDLTLFSQGQRRRDGTLHLEPKRLPTGSMDGRSTPLNVLSGSGSFSVNIPGVNVQRIVMRGSVEIGDQQQFERLELTASLHEAKQSGPGLTLILEGRPARDEWHYILKQAGEILREDNGSMARMIAAADPHIPGMDLSGLEQMQRQQLAATRVTASRGSLRLGGESVETYVVRLQQGETVAATIHFNQLGQILAIKTFTGYDLYEEGIAP